jgi:hypothetical protein
MRDLRIEVSGVNYLIWIGMDNVRIGKAIGINNCLIRALILRKFVEVDGTRYELTEVEGFESWDGVKVFIPNNIEKIKENCFSRCKSLSAVIFESESKMKEINKNAFRRSMLKSILIPSNVENLGDCCFYKCKSLRDIVFEKESKLRKVGERAFQKSKLESIHIPSNVENIGKMCFFRCESLSRVTFESESKLKEIEDYGFWVSNLKRVEIPSNVERIGMNCFSECESLCEISFASNSKLKEIGDYAFSGTEVISINIPAKCEIVCGNSFFGLMFVTLSNENKFLVHKDDFLMNTKGDVLIRYFGESNKVLIDHEIKNISDGCFSGLRDLYTVSFAANCKLTEIGKSAFCGSGLRTFYIPNTVEKLGECCFSSCKSLCEIAFGSKSKLKEICNNTFRGTGLKAINIPSSVEKIGCCCFNECEYLSKVVFESGSKLKEIGSNSFCFSQVKTIEIPKECEILTGRSLWGLESVTVSKGNKFFVYKDDFLIDVNKKKLIRYFGRSSRVYIEKGIEIISKGCFSECEPLPEIVFESDSKLKEIDDCAFGYTDPKTGLEITAVQEFDELLDRCILEKSMTRFEGEEE